MDELQILFEVHTLRAKTSDQERALITRRDLKRPYGAKITFQILQSAYIGGLENVTILLESGAVATLEPARSASWEGGKRFQIALEGFRTAAVAEYEGLRFAQALLLSAISLNFGLRLNYHTQEPTVVFERFRSEGISTWSEGVIGWTPQKVLEELVGACTHPVLDRTLLLSMELYCAALLELNERARFVTMVSALEPLAKQENLGSEVSTFVENTVAALENIDGIEVGIRASLKGRLYQLRNESVRQALLRLSRTWFPMREDVRQRIDSAYALRSELLHEGTLLDPDIDISAETTQISKVLRAIFEQATNHSFYVPTDV